MEGLAYPPRVAWGALPHLMAPAFPQNSTHNNQSVMESDCRGWRMGGDHLIDQRSPISYDFEVKNGLSGGMEVEIERGKLNTTINPTIRIRGGTT